MGRGDTWSWLMAHWKAHGRLSIRLNWTFFAICYGSGVMWWNVYSLAVSARGLTSVWVMPISHSWRQNTGLPDGKDRIPLHSLILTQYWSMANGRTDGWTDRICRSIHICFAVRCKNAPDKKNGSVNYEATSDHKTVDNCLEEQHLCKTNKLCLKKTVQNCFCLNFVKFPPILIILTER